METRVSCLQSPPPPLFRTFAEHFFYINHRTSNNGHHSTTATLLQRSFVSADSPYINSCFNLSTMTTFFCPLGGHCREHDPELLGTQKELPRCSVLRLIILYTMSVSVFLGNSHLVYAIIRKRNIFHQVSSLSVYWG